jgi:hypothetical protein
MTNKYDIQCEGGVCTAKMVIPARRAYAVPQERGGPLAKSLNLAALPAEITQRTGEGPYLGVAAGIKHREIDEAKRTILFVASDESEDRYGDIIRQSGWQLENYKKNPIGLWAHDSNGMCSAHNGMPVARGAKIEVRGKELLWLAQFWPAGQYEFSDLIFNAYNKGFMNAVSVGFIPIEFKWIEEGDGMEFLKCELLEVSFVPLPANPNALVSEDAFKGFAAAVRAVEIQGEPIAETREKPSATLRAFCDEGKRLAQRFEQKIDGLHLKVDRLARAEDECPRGEDCPMKESVASGFEVRAETETWTRRKFREWLKANGFSKRLLHADTNEDWHVSPQAAEPGTLPRAPEGIAYFRDGQPVVIESEIEKKTPCACKAAATEIEDALEALRVLYAGAETDEQREAIRRVIRRTTDDLTAKAEEPEIDPLETLAGEPIADKDMLEDLAEGNQIAESVIKEKVEADTDLLQVLSEAPAPPNVAA